MTTKYIPELEGFFKVPKSFMLCDNCKKEQALAGLDWCYACLQKHAASRVV